MRIRDATAQDGAGPRVPREAPGTTSVLAIALDRYAHARPLANCVRDASDVVRILTTAFGVEPERADAL